MQNKNGGLVTTFITGLLGLSMVLADPTPEDAKDYRTSVMTALRGHIGAVSMYVRGLVDHNDEFFLKHAEGLADGAAELKHVFPEGSNVGDSEALPAIWEEPKVFAEAIAELEEATAALQIAAATGDRAAIGVAFRGVGNACRGCHDRFRVDDE